MAERGLAQHEGVVVTGLGAISPLGCGVDSLWEGLCAARAGIAPVDFLEQRAHRTRIAGEVRAEGDGLDSLRPAERARLSRSDRFGLIAAFEAARDAKIELAGRRAGVFFGSSTAGMREGEELYWRMLDEPEARVPLTLFAAHQNNAPADAIARALDLCGPVSTQAAACAASSMALEAALDALEAGDCDLALAGGSDALCHLTYAGFNSLRAVDEEVCRPFRADRAGLSMGEGAGVLLLERAEHAAARGARVRARLTGAASTCDAHHMTAPQPEGAGVARALTLALARAGRGADEVDCVNAHGTGTPHNDAAEWRALESVFGARARELPLVATKAAVGHLLGGCGGLEAVATVRTLEEQLAPSVPGGGTVDPDAPGAIAFGAPRVLADARVAVSINLAFGGANAALVFERAEGTS